MDNKMGEDQQDRMVMVNRCRRVVVCKQTELAATIREGIIIMFMPGKQGLRGHENGGQQEDDS
jgi:hypothetical protein